MLYVIINEGLNFPNKPKTVSYYVTLKSKSGVKAGSKPCLMGKNNTSHPIWNEHLELSEVEIGEALKVNIIDVKEEKSVNRLVGTAEIEVKDGEVGESKTNDSKITFCMYADSLNLLQSWM